MDWVFAPSLLGVGCTLQEAYMSYDFLAELGIKEVNSGVAHGSFIDKPSGGELVRTSLCPSPVKPCQPKIPLQVPVTAAACSNPRAARTPAVTS